MDFDTAIEECKSMGYRLIAIENQAEYDALNELLQDCKFLFLTFEKDGISRPSKSKKFVVWIITII